VRFEGKCPGKGFESKFDKFLKIRHSAQKEMKGKAFFKSAIRGKQRRKAPKGKSESS
jgi:hypothetical protein